MSEVPVSEALLVQTISDITPDSVLVGGQALAVWVVYYNIPAFLEPRIGAISADVDILGTRADVSQIAKATAGRPVFPSKHDLTALVGQVLIPVDRQDHVNIDVLHQIVGLKAKHVRRNAETITWREFKFRIMHPLDVLASRLENLRQLPAKQNEQGAMQTRLSIAVVRAHILDVLAGDEKVATKLIERAATLAVSKAGRLATQDYAIDFAEALPLDDVHNELFQKERRPRLEQALGIAPAESIDDPIAPPRRD